MNTELIYMKNMQDFTCSAKILEVAQYEDRLAVTLDQTIFYPQGGGQPYDTGKIEAEDNSFSFGVQEVRFIDGKVLHIGILNFGEIKLTTEVVCKVDKERRTLNTRLHSAGHLVDLVLKELNVNWVAGKGYHFPEGPYVEYSGSLEDLDLENLKQSIENIAKEIIDKDINTTLIFDNTKLQNGKPMRTVYYGDFGIACGGTHVSSLSQISELKIRKIKKEKETIRVSYSIL